jgi:biotin operon repressor
LKEAIMLRTNASLHASTSGNRAGRTAAEDKLWAALHAHPGVASGELATHAGIGRSTAGKILAGWASEGSVTRTSKSASDGRRAADTWMITETTDDQVTCATTAQPESQTTGIAPDAATNPTAATDRGDITASGPGTEEQQRTTPSTPTSAGTMMPDGAGKAARLGKGALRGMVEDYLTEHPGEQFSPSAIGKALGRSSGAVSNALDKLAADGYAVQTQEKPKRFTAKSIPPIAVDSGGSSPDK